MTRKGADHVSLHGSDVACFHCGARVQVIPPGGAPITMVVAASKAFAKIHQGCRETADSPTRKVESNPCDWERGLFVGTSSATIFRVMMGRWPHGVSGPADVPHDPNDFSRCHRLLQAVPEWRSRLSEVAMQYPRWAALVDAWDELEGLFVEKDYKALYEKMKALRGDER